MLQKLNDLIDQLADPHLEGEHDAVHSLALILKEYIERNMFVPLCTRPKETGNKDWNALKKLFAHVTGQIVWHEERVKTCKNPDVIRETT